MAACMVYLLVSMEDLRHSPPWKQTILRAPIVEKLLDHVDHQQGHCTFLPHAQIHIHKTICTIRNIFTHRIVSVYNVYTFTFYFIYITLQCTIFCYNIFNVMCVWPYLVIVYVRCSTVGLTKKTFFTTLHLIHNMYLTNKELKPWRLKIILKMFDL